MENEELLTTPEEETEDTVEIRNFKIYTYIWLWENSKRKNRAI